MHRLAPAARAHLLRLHDESYDARLGGLRTAQKFIDRDSVEYALAHHLNSDVRYPELDRAAGYVCTARRCSAPAFDANRYSEQIQKLIAQRVDS